MDSVGAGAARGLQAGWQMGMQADQAARQREQDALNRAQQDRVFGLQQDAATRAEQRLQHETERQDAADQYKLLTDQIKDITTQSASLQQAGQGVPPELATRYQDVTGALRAHRERALAPLLAAKKQDDDRYWAGVQAGQIDPTTTPSGEFYSRFSRAIGMTPAGLAKAAQGAQLVQQGFDAGNQQLMLQGVNQLVERDLRAGEGGPSPHGGVITRKEVVGLLPVKDANGVEHPDKVFPVIRTYVMHPEGGGQEDYYDAPLTQNRTGDPNDPVQALDLNHAFDYMGRVGAMAQLLQHPDLQRKLAEGEQETGAQTQRDVETINALGRAHLAEAAKGADAQFYMQLQRMVALGQMTQEQADKAWAVRTKTATSADTAARVEGSGNRAEGRNATTLAVAAGHDATRLQATGMQQAGATARSGAKAAGMGKGAKAAGMGTGAGAKDISKLSGDDLLNAIDPSDATYVRRLTSGLADPKNIPARGTERVRLIKLAQQYDPTFNEHDFGTVDRVEKAFSVGLEGRKVRSINVAIDHLGTLEEASKALKNGNMQAFNQFANYLATATGRAAPTDFESIKQLVADEVVSAIVPGVGALADRTKAGEIFAAVKSPDQMSGAIDKVKKLMGGQMNGLYQQYKGGGGKKDFRDFLTAQGADAMRSVNALPPAGAAPMKAPGMGIQPVAPMTGSGAPRGAVPALPPGFKEF